MAGLTCGSTHDSTSYALSAVSRCVQAGQLPKWAHIVFDDAYVCTQQELSPWSKPGKKQRPLTPWQDSFNYHLSLNRQCIERAFGLFIGCWGLFWRPLSVAKSRIPLIVRCAMKLHNIRVARFGAVKATFVPQDVECGDNSAPLFAPGNIRAGHRTDMDEMRMNGNKTNTRRLLTSMLRQRGKLRPPHSTSFKYARMRNREVIIAPPGDNAALDQDEASDDDAA